MCQNNDGLIQGIKTFLALTNQLPKNLFFDVKKISSPGCHPCIRKTLDFFNMLAHDQAKCIFSSKVTFRNQRFYFVTKKRVFNHLGMGTQNCAVLRTNFICNDSLIRSHLNCSISYPDTKPFKFFCNFRRIDRPLRNQIPFCVKQQSRAYDNPWVNRYSSINFHQHLVLNKINWVLKRLPLRVLFQVLAKPKENLSQKPRALLRYLQQQQQA